MTFDKRTFHHLPHRVMHNGKMLYLKTPTLKETNEYARIRQQLKWRAAGLDENTGKPLALPEAVIQ
jgi:hypothetical protein